jgi:hypothetical protein
MSYAIATAFPYRCHSFFLYLVPNPISVAYNGALAPLARPITFARADRSIVYSSQVASPCGQIAAPRRRQLQRTLICEMPSRRRQ